jgi:hypothetical protein
MDAQEFVDAIKIVVRDGAAEAAMASLHKPVGRRPDPATLRRSEWYHSLDEDERRMLAAVVMDAVEAATFRFLCVIDGVSAIENGPEKGNLELRYVKNGTVVVLNAPDIPMLHDLW